jgi:hypothetical protein
MKTVKLLKRFGGLHPEGEEIQVNELLEKHLLKGGYIAEGEPVKKPKKGKK